MSQLESSRVLLVDDDTGLLESMEAVLAEQFTVRTCASGPEALRLLDQENQFAGVAQLKRSNAALKAVMLGDRR